MPSQHTLRLYSLACHSPYRHQSLRLFCCLFLPSWSRCTSAPAFFLSAPFFCVVQMLHNSWILAIPTQAEHHHAKVSAAAPCPLMVKALDAVRGIPAVGLAVTVYRKTDDTWTEVVTGVTGRTGEIHNLMTDADFPAGLYKVKFDTKPYWKKAGISAFAEYLEIVFEAHAGVHTHYTLPVLMSQILCHCS
uniref:Transthyretin n=1 Tax=Eptatretus burgeri TaxID=7764 RepID=A0A8C4X0B2_EPTBU